MNWLPQKNIVVPMDFSDDSFASLETAREMADDMASIHVLYVLSELEAADPAAIWFHVDDEKRIRQAKASVAEELKKRSWQDMSIEVLVGDPGCEIAEYAKKIDAGLVIVASHGQSGFKNLFLGSVAERVVRLAHCHVLVLKHKP